MKNISPVISIYLIAIPKVIFEPFYNHQLILFKFYDKIL